MIFFCDDCVSLEALAGEMGPNTRVNCIAPRFVPTRFPSFLVKNETIGAHLDPTGDLR
ncbi:hypothetical protein C2845_PM15G03200 [Panicum miliaceum]|uniref:Uncharacterized protein n=1 Tax=Panicum miliaceum TaxID=4540 RepID=A0A3L6QD95_PANMI|nr:hypothetical protein C2845_PM15G03200 [Panicum miliaceum]